MKNGILELERIAGELGIEIPDTLVVATPNVGFHLYFTGTAQSTSNRIAPGIDVRSSGGYVIAPGSVIDGKPYIVEQDVAEWDVMPCPPQLLALANTKKRDAARAPANIELDQPQNIARAIRYLKEDARPAIEGQGGDTGTYEIAAAVRDLGISEGLCLELMAEHYNPRCKPAWSQDELATKVSNAYRYAENDPGCDAVAPVTARIPGVAMDKLLAESVASPVPAAENIGEGEWRFGLHDPVADADLPPITYRDALKLWPDSPGKTVTQVIAGPKEHKTNWIMAELFRLAFTGSRRDQ